MLKNSMMLPEHSTVEFFFSKSSNKIKTDVMLFIPGTILMIEKREMEKEKREQS